MSDGREVVPPTRRIVVVGRGRAGGSFARALSTDVRPGRARWAVELVPGRGDHLPALAATADLVLLCVPDAAVAAVAAVIEPGDAVVAHVAGSLGLEAAAPHERRASIHPLATLPNAELGAERLVGATFAVAGDDLAREVVASLDGVAIVVPEEQRAAYHAAACIASNHLVALLGQVERVAATTGVPLDAYLDLVRQSIENVAAVGPAAALTGPAARGDAATLDRHRAAIDPSELAAYDAMVELCQRLAVLR